MDNIEEDNTGIERELLLRQSRLYFPEVQDWILEIAVDAYLKNNGEGDIPTVEYGRYTYC